MNIDHLTGIPVLEGEVLEPDPAEDGLDDEDFYDATDLLERCLTFLETTLEDPATLMPYGRRASASRLEQAVKEFLETYGITEEV